MPCIILPGYVFLAQSFHGKECVRWNGSPRRWVRMDAGVANRRNDFAVLRNDRGGHNPSPIVFLSNSSRTLMPDPVWNAMDTFYREENAAVYHGVCSSTLVKRSAAALKNARDEIRRLLGVMDGMNGDGRKGGDLVLTRNMSEGVHVVAHAWSSVNLKAGDEVILSIMDEDAMVDPWRVAAERYGLKLKFLRMTEDGTKLDIFSLPELLSSRTRVIAMSRTSSVLGCLNPIEDIVDFARGTGCRVLLDVSHSLSHRELSDKELQCDWIVGSAQTMYGPSGAGFLYSKLDRLLETPALATGGCTMDWMGVPHGEVDHLEVGMVATAEAVGFGKACSYITDVGIQDISRIEIDLGAYLHEKLRKPRGVHVLGPSSSRTNSCCFLVDGFEANYVAQRLAEDGVFIDSGDQGARLLHRKLGIKASNCASVCFYNTRSDVDLLVEKIGSWSDLQRSPMDGKLQNSRAGA